jgi:hypothetical protein
MSTRPAGIRPLAFAAIGGIVTFFALLVVYAVLSGVIEPQNRIDAFLLGQPHHRHPLQLAAAGWTLYVAAGALLGASIVRLVRSISHSPWSLLLAFGLGYTTALAWIVPGHGFASLFVAPMIGHTMALITVAACVLLARQLGVDVH